jgi:hypothetical protein
MSIGGKNMKRKRKREKRKKGIEKDKMGVKGYHNIN